MDRAAAGEAVATTFGGGVLGGAALAAFGLGWPGAVIGAANGAIGGWRGTYAWRERDGVVAFVLDSTWALPLTAAALATHAVAALQRGRGAYVEALSRRANRHVYGRGVRFRRGFLVTIGNTVHGAGADAATDARRRRIVTDHEDVHVWQGRWLGPLFPLLYGGWLLLGGAAGALVWLTARRGEPLGKVVETCGYYLNPFEWWAYSRGANWPPAAKVGDLGWRRPCARPLAERRAARASRRAPTAPPAARR